MHLAMHLAISLTTAEDTIGNDAPSLIAVMNDGQQAMFSCIILDSKVPDRQNSVTFWKK